MQKYVKFSAMPSLQVQAGHCSDHHRHRHCHHHRHRGEPALSQSIQFPISLHLHCQKEPSIAKCSNAKQASEMIKLASIETTAPNFSASKRMSVQISVYLQGRCEGIEKQGKVMAQLYYDSGVPVQSTFRFKCLLQEIQQNFELLNIQKHKSKCSEFGGRQDQN